jgi:voltage-gated potassium channel
MFDLVIMFISIYSVSAILAISLYDLPLETVRLIHKFDYAVCFLFFIDFCYRFYKAPSKLAYMKWGWIDLLSCIPMVDYARFARLFQLIRLIRILRAFKSVRELLQHSFVSRVEGTVVGVATISLLMLVFSAIAILIVEDAPNSNIKTAEDALWWSFVTITTVGYGDYYPVTTAGRLIAALLMFVGVGLFGTFTALVSSWFIGERR